MWPRDLFIVQIRINIHLSVGQILFYDHRNVLNMPPPITKK